MAHKDANGLRTYAIGTPIGNIHHFDRSQHVTFKCEHGVWHSKDPFVSSCFPEADNPCHCLMALDDEAFGMLPLARPYTIKL